MRTINIKINANGSINSTIPQMFSNESNANKMVVYASDYVNLDAYIDFNLNGVLYRSEKQTWINNKFEFVLTQIICNGVIKAQFVFIDENQNEILKSGNKLVSFNTNDHWEANTENVQPLGMAYSIAPVKTGGGKFVRSWD